MIRHCVFARFRNDVTDDERAAIHADLEALRSVIDGMAKVEFSANTSPEPFAPASRTASPSTSAMPPHATPIWCMRPTAEPALGWSRRLKAEPTG